MLYEHYLMFRLTAPAASIDRALATASEIVAQPLRNIERTKRKTRIRNLGLITALVVSFEFDGDAEMMERMRDEVWDANDDVISTLTVPHPQHTNEPRYLDTLPEVAAPLASKLDSLSAETLYQRYREKRERTVEPPRPRKPRQKPIAFE